MVRNNSDFLSSHTHDTFTVSGLLCVFKVLRAIMYPELSSAECNYLNK